MNDAESTRLRCDGISNRGGFIETRLVHANHINLEAWSIDPDALNPSVEWVTDASESAVTGNVELELDLRTAMQLAESLNELVAIAGNEKVGMKRCQEPLLLTSQWQAIDILAWEDQSEPRMVGGSITS